MNSILFFNPTVRRPAACANRGARAARRTRAVQGEALEDPRAETHIAGGQVTAKSGNRPAKMTNMQDFDPTARRRVVSAARLARTPIPGDPATA